MFGFLPGLQRLQEHLGECFVAAIWIAYRNGIYLNYRSSRGSRTDELAEHERKVAAAVAPSKF